MKRNPAHLIDELLVNKILTYRPSHPTAIILRTAFAELQNCVMYRNDPEGFTSDKEITLITGNFIKWYIKTNDIDKEYYKIAGIEQIPFIS